MASQFTKHYTLAEARALLPQIRAWLEQLHELTAQLEKSGRVIHELLTAGNDAGGPTVNRWVRALVDFREVLREFQTREIQLKDLDRGLLDFPAIMDGREVFLCWESGEDDIEFWHDLETGYAGREPL